MADENTTEELKELEDYELIEKAQANDDDAFAELVRRYQARLRAFAYTFIPDSEDVFEVVQDAFLNAYRHIDRFDTNRAFYPWIRTICQHRIFNYFRSMRRKRNVNLQLVDDALWEKLSEEVGDEATSQNSEEWINALRECLQELPGEQSELIQERYHREVPVKKIAESLKTSATGISMRLSRIRRKLRKCVDGKMEQRPDG